MPGPVTALAAGEFGAADGFTDIAVGVTGPDGEASMLIFDAAKGFSNPLVQYQLAEPASAFEFDGLDDDPFLDVAVAAGNEILIVHGWGRKEQVTVASRVERIEVGPGLLRGLAVGEFVWDRKGRHEMAALADDGNVQIVQHRRLDTRRFTESEQANLTRGKINPINQAMDVESLPSWRPGQADDWVASRRFAGSNLLSASVKSLTRTHISYREMDELMLMGEGASKLAILRPMGPNESSPDKALTAHKVAAGAVAPYGVGKVTLDIQSEPIAVLPLPQKLNGVRDMVVLSANSVEPSIVPNAPNTTITVDRTDDPSGGSLAAASVCDATPNNCSLRGAFEFANNPANPGTTINLPAGTYILSTNGTNASGCDGNAVGDLGANQSTNIVGAGAATTIIRQTGTGPANDGDRVMCMNELFTLNLVYNFSGVSFVGGRDGTAAGTGTALGGGGIIGGEKGNVLTLTNVVLANNQVTVLGSANIGGGGAQITGGDLNITNCTIGGTSAPGAYTDRTSTNTGNLQGGSGGGIMFTPSAPKHTASTGVLTVTGTTFSSNTAGSIGSGGGGADLLTFGFAAPGGGGTGSATIGTSTFSNNTATPGNGGGILVESLATTVATTSFTNNSAGNRGGGIFVGGASLLLNGTTPSITFTGNMATNGGSSVSTSSAVTVDGTNTTIGGDIEVNTLGSWTNNTGSALAPTNVVITGGTFNMNNSTMNVGGNLTIGPGPVVGSTFNGNTGTVNIQGNFVLNAGGAPTTTLNAGTGTFNFNGTGAQSITNGTSITFFNLTDSNTTQPLTLNNSFAVNGSLNVNGANAIFAPVAGAIISGTGTLTGTGTARVTRTAATPDFLTQYSITNKTLTNLTIDYNGAGNQTVNNTPAYGHLRISGTGTKTLQGATSITGNLTIAAAALDASASNFFFNLDGNWTNSVGAAGFVPRAGTVTFDGTTGTQTLTGDTTFFNLTLNNSGATTNFGTTATTIGNDLVASAGTMDGGTSTVIFTGVTDNAGAISGASAKNFWNLQVNNPATISNSAGGNITIENNYTNNGTFTQAAGLTTTFALDNSNDGAHTLSGSGATTFGNISINGSNTVDAGSHNFNVAGSTFTVTGAFTGNTSTANFNGSAAQTITGNGTKNFSGLLINNANGVQVANGTGAVDASVSGLLTLTTDLTVASGAILQQSGTSTGAADVIGTVRRADLGVTERAFGNLSNTITINSGTPPSQLDFNLVKAAPGTFPSAVKVVPRDITLTPTGGNGISATVKLRYIDPGELNGPGITESRLILWKNISGVWTPQGGTVNAASNFVSLGSVSSFSEWAIAEGSDLTLSKANNVGGSAVTGQAWNWTLTASNSGSPATFTAGQTILTDNLPNSNLNYGAVTVQNVSNITGSANISCAIASNDLTCTANGGSVTFASNLGASSFDVVFSATPQTVGTYQNPRSGGSAQIDPNSFIAESNESNNSPTPNTVTVGKANTTTAITSDSPDPSVVGEAVTVQWSVTVNGPGAVGGALTGNVTVSDGTDICVAAVSAGQCNITFTSPGAKNLTATYAGDSNYNGSASSPATAHTVNKADTTTTITSDNPDPSSPGQSATIQWSVTVNSPGSGAPTGNVQVTVSGGAETCNAAVGTGQCSLVLNSVGARTITATYAGDTNFKTSSDTENHQVCTNGFVTTNADSGAGSLRQAIADACDNATITFDSAGTFSTPQTITLTSGEILIDKNLTINAGSNRVTFSGNNASRIFHINSGKTVNIVGLTISGGSATDGGAILNDGALTIVNSTLSGNVASADGGAIGATATGTSLTLINTTVSGNTAAGSGGGVIVLGGTVTSMNSTITNNRADSDNNSLGEGGGIGVQSATVTLENTIVAGNFNEDGAIDATDDISGTVDPASSFNLIGTGGSGGLTDGVNGNQTGVADAGLGALANNGGTTQTHALLPLSPAIEAGSNANLPIDAFDLDGDANFVEPLPVDQRGTGFARIADSADANTTQTVDIGAYEADPTVEDITDKSTDEDTLMVIPFNVGDSTTAFSSITATSSDATLVPNLPANINITGSGGSRNLNISPAANRSGTSTITVTVTKTVGGTALSMSDTFVLTVNEVNDPPSFLLPGNPPASNEDAGPQTINGYATSISEGPNETGQTPLTFNVSVTGTTGTLSFTSAPSIDATTGNLTYTASPNTNGTANMSVTLTDSGSNTPPNSNTSAAQSFTITVNAVNDAPSFSLAGDPPTINDNAGAQTVNAFATSISAGPGDEAGQTLTFNLSPTGSTGTLTFSTPPTIDPATGNLTYTATNGTDGTASFDVILSDNGSNVPPNSNTSAAQSFTITVNGINDPPVNTVPGPITTPQDTILTFTGGNQISVADSDAANAPSDGVINVSLTTTNATLKLNGTAGLTITFGADGTSTVAFDGTIPDINTALNGLQFTPTAGYTGTASIQIVSDDKGKTGTGGAKLDSDSINITVTAPDTIYINEVLFNPDNMAQNEYIELRGTPNATLPAGTYFVVVDGDAGFTGHVTTYIDLSGLSFGSNGFLVLLQTGNTYTTAAGATVVSSTGTPGFSGLPGGIFQSDSGDIVLENDSATFMLIETGVSPTLSYDIDANDDGAPDGSVYAGWSIRDSIGNVDGTAAGDHGYGAINYSTTGSGSSTGTVVPVNFALTYVGRRGDTTGSAATDWVASGTLGGTAPNFTLNSASTEVLPSSFINKTLDHIGSTNFLNKSPVNTVPGAQATDEDTALTFNAGNANLISIADADANGASVKVTLSATNGTISLSTTGGLTFTPAGASNDGTDNAQMIFTGNLTDINAALNGLTFKPTPAYNGPASLAIDTDDLGNTGVDGAKTDSDTVNITVNAVNDPPSFVIPATAPTVNEDAGAQTLSGFATSISQGAGDPAQVLTFNITLSGVSTLSFTSGPAISSATGDLTYTTAPDSNGTATFNVTLSDNGSNVSPDSNTSGVQQFTITVTAVNDAPSFQIVSNPPTVNEDAAAQTVAGFATSFKAGPVTATDEAGQTLVGYTLTPTSTTGNLTFSSGPSIDNTGQLSYTPTGNTSGTATFNAVATDSGSSTSPNVNLSAPLSFTITVSAQNDAPLLDNTGNMTLTAINEDVANASNPGTLISDLIASAGGDRITDVDASALEGLAVTAVDNTSGTWQFSIDNGVNWTPFATPDTANSRLLAANALTRVRFIPNADFNGTVNMGLTFRAWDQSSGTNGSTADTTTTGATTAFSTASETASITITAVNDAPVPFNDTLSDSFEDGGARAIALSDLTSNDSRGAANESSQTLTVKAVSNPVGGAVQLIGPNVVFTSTPNYNGAVSFQYTVEDDGVPALSSVAPATVSFNIIAIADTPSVTNASTNENTQSTSGLVITRNAADGPEVTHFRIMGITGGTLFQNDGTTQIADNSFITAGQGGAGLRFTPSVNSTATGSFQVQASTQATIAGLGGGFTTALITVNAVNDAPTLDPIGNLNINEDAGLQTVNLVGITGGPGETQALSITATSNNTALIPDPTVSYTSPNASGTLSMTPVANQSGTALITVTVRDNGGTSNGGVDTVVRTFTVTVNAVNDGPQNSVPGAQSTVRNSTLSLTGANLISITDVDAGGSAVQVTLTATNGTISLSGIAGLAFTIGDGTSDAQMSFTGTLASINATLNGLSFTPTVDYAGAASIQITTNDQGNTGAGGALSDTDTVSITVLERMYQFSTTNYEVGEGGGHATITVTRNGGTTQAASVDYETGDVSGLTNCDVNTGNGSPRCDFTEVGGRLNFAAGEASKTFEIPIVNDVYVEGPETVPLTLSNPQGGILGTPSTATLTITDDDLAPGAANPIDTRSFFVRTLYMDILNREPDGPGLAGWLNRLNNCPQVGETLQQCDEIQVASDFFRSAEFFQRAFYIYRFYEFGLGRKPTYDEYQRDFRMVAGFLSDAELEQRKQQYAEAFSHRAEFRALYDSKNDGDDYINALVATGGVTPSNRTNVSIREGALIITRGQALRELLESPEVSVKFFNKAFVVVGYFAFLRRDPDAAYQVWLDRLNTTGDYREMIRGFIQSQEYRRRFGP